MTTFLLRADDVLRRHEWITRSRRPLLAIVNLVSYIVLFGAVYGGVMGSFGAMSGQSQWPLQMAYSAIKVPLLLVATFLLGLPSFFVFNTLLGLRHEFAEAVRALLAAQAGLAIVLAAFAPFTVLWYSSSSDYPQAVLFNALMFAAASFTAQWLLRGYYQPLIKANNKNRGLLWAWIVVYAFIGIQMGWIMRPFVGTAEVEIQFFREGAWDNAYVKLVRILWAAWQ